MTTVTLNIQLDDKVKQAYQATSEERRASLQKLIARMLQEFAESRPESLLTIMDEMSREAQAKGLTPEILDAILRDE
jgi:hypothetical protein